MFYGGRLLSHLSADDDEIEDFIALRRLNRNLAIVIDSDKDSPRRTINATKQRIQTEFAKDGGFAWITAGREMENYVHHDTLQEAVKSTHSKYVRPCDGGRYDHAYHFMKAGGTHRAPPLQETSVDKVKVARAVCSKPASLDVLDLRKRVNELVGFIRAANGLDDVEHPA